MLCLVGEGCAFSMYNMRGGRVSLVKRQAPASSKHNEPSHFAALGFHVFQGPVSSMGLYPSKHQPLALTLLSLIPRSSTVTLKIRQRRMHGVRLRMDIVQDSLQIVNRQIEENDRDFERLLTHKRAQFTR